MRLFSEVMQSFSTFIILRLIFTREFIIQPTTRCKFTTAKQSRKKLIKFAINEELELVRYDKIMLRFDTMVGATLRLQ